MKIDISLIICTYNRADALSNCLDAVAQAFTNTHGKTIELIVINNNSKDNTFALLKNKAENFPIPLRIFTEKKQGLAAARNRGIKESSGALIVFTDDDCHPSDSYLKDIIDNFASDDKSVLRGGRVELGDPSDLPLTIQTNPNTIKWQKNNTPHNEHLGGGIILGCNMMFPRTLADSVGPFDERLGAGTTIPAAEDTDFVFRCYMKGFAVEYIPNMVVHHFHGRKDQEEAKALLKNYVVGTGALYAKHHIRHPNFQKTFRKVLKIQKHAPSQHRHTAGESVQSGVPIDLSGKEKIKLALKGMYLFYISCLTRQI